MEFDSDCLLSICLLWWLNGKKWCLILNVAWQILALLNLFQQSMNEIQYRGKYYFKRTCQQKVVGWHRQISVRGQFQHFFKNLCWKESTKGTNLQSGLLKNKISCFCDVKIPQPARLWNYSRDVLAFLLHEEPSLFLLFLQWSEILSFAVTVGPAGSILSGVLGLLRGEKTRALDPEQLRGKESRKLCPALDPFQNTIDNGIMVSIFTVRLL